MSHQTVDDLLRAWDAGENIWTLEMGGLGPGYEQAIQIAAVEFARENRNFQRSQDDKADWEKFGASCDAALKRFDEDVGGLTGAMYGAAKQLAWWWCTIGPEALIEKCKREGKEDRVMLCSKTFPRAPEPPAEVRN